MNDVLARIAEDRRRRVEEQRMRTPAHVLRARLGTIEPAGRLERALRRPRPVDPLRMICEFKRASPSKGVLRADGDPVATARVYEQGGATALSVVTEPDHFLGDPEWIPAVRAVTRLPILMKDFVVDPWQILDAAVRGADAILLIAAMLSEVRMQRFIAEARLVGLDCLVEVHDARELATALRAGGTLIGINNRDLHTFHVDLATSLTLLPQIPPMVTAVAESGLSRPEDLARLRDTRCDAVLIGEAFMTSADPAASVAALATAARGG